MTGQKQVSGKPDRRSRLEQALRENLKRRKEQQRARGGVGHRSDGDPEPQNSAGISGEHHD